MGIVAIQGEFHLTRLHPLVQVYLTKGSCGRCGGWGRPAQCLRMRISNFPSRSPRPLLRTTHVVRSSGRGRGLCLQRCLSFLHRPQITRFTKFSGLNTTHLRHFTQAVQDHGPALSRGNLEGLRKDAEDLLSLLREIDTNEDQLLALHDQGKKEACVALFRGAPTLSQWCREEGGGPDEDGSALVFLIVRRPPDPIGRTSKEILLVPPIRSGEREGGHRTRTVRRDPSRPPDPIGRTRRYEETLLVPPIRSGEPLVLPMWLSRSDREEDVKGWAGRTPPPGERGGPHDLRRRSIV